MSSIPISTKEGLFYFIVYIAYAIYGLLMLFDIRNDVIKVSRLQFAKGWWFVGRPRDDTNDEFENFTDYLLSSWPCYTLHAIILYFVRKWWPRKQSIANAITCVCACFYIMPVISVIWLLLLVSSFYVCIKSKFNSKINVWLLAAFWTLLSNIVHKYDYIFKMLGYKQYFLLFLSLSWSILRCCSYAFVRISDMRKSKDKDNSKDLSIYNWQNFYGYVLYFPCLIYGPFISFERYKESILIQNNTKTKAVSWISFLFQMVRCIFWMFVLQYIMHFIYVYYMSRDVASFKLLRSGLGHFAAGYYMAELFFMYYVVTYGLGISFAQFEGLNPPKRPRCIGCIHYYSDMWKHFDEGLYEFLFKHIYAQVCKPTSTVLVKTFATALTFTFVYVWHGCYWYTLLWSCLNFCCLIFEKCFKACVRSAWYKYWTTVQMGLSATTINRLEAFVGTQIFIFAAFSNVFFIGGYEMGKILMLNAYTTGILNYINLTFCCYCYFQTSEIIKRKQQGL